MNNDSQNYQTQPGQTFIINQQVNEKNGVGTAGFVLAIFGVILGWVPVIGWILWLLGLILSIVGVTRNPKGLAIAGLVISLIGIILLIAVFGAILGGAALLG
ncbi:MAG: hypothetical protein CVU12_08650 [Bacteroidetes bacterium HGW-Bacteroidetes-7]|jgi:hypothetical protein|nr:MAG: hypothetical protein CVU12_08650 [Bacteroidetes bacterium HGW-Bacteroidetes-7]